MALSYPLSLPATRVARRMRWRMRSSVGVAQSPFSLTQQVFAHTGERWEAEVDLPPMKRADAAAWQGFLAALNGVEGTFLMGDPVETTPRGTWAGAAPQFNGAHAAGVKTITVKNLLDGVTWKAGDRLQVGSGSSTHLHLVAQDGSIAGSPTLGTIEIWPRLREAATDGQAIALASPLGLWRLASNLRGWDLDSAQIYGIAFSCVEAL